MSTTIKCGLSEAFYNKTNRTNKKSAFGASFKPTTLPVSDLIDHITTGKAWTQGFFKTNIRRKDQFISSQTLALDLDDGVSVARTLEEPLIRDHATLVHPSPSSTEEQPKTRVIFILSEPVDSVHRWEALQRGLIRYFRHLNPDEACKDSARLFYGSAVPGAHINANARLSLVTAGNLTIEEAEAEYAEVLDYRERQDVPSADFRHVKGSSGGDPALALVADVERLLGVANAPVNERGFTMQACKCPVRHHQHDDTYPAAHWNPGIKALKCFKCGDTYNTHEVATALGLDVSSYYHSSSWRKNTQLVPTLSEDDLPLYQKIEMPPFTADQQVDLRYISTIGPQDATKILMKSPIGTGKTQFAAQHIQHLDGKIKDRPPRVLAITHRQALADNLATRLADSGYIFECYMGLEAIDLRRIGRLVISYDSLWKLASMNETLPQYDLIIIDEIEQFHQHLGGDTMRGPAAARAYRILRQLVQQTPHFLGMDAHMTDVSRTWLQGVTGEKPLCIENTHRLSRGVLTLHQTRETAIQEALTMARQNCGPIAIPTNSRGTAKKLYRLFCDEIGAEHVRVIHGGNSNDDDTQHFIRHINEEITKYKVLIYSPSLGTGVDITTRVWGVIGIFSQKPLSPEDMHQMMGRCRKATTRHAWVQTNQGNLETDWRAIYRRHEDNALMTGMHCIFNEAGVLAVSDIQKSMLKLLAMLEAQRNETMNDPFTYFLALAWRQGYQLHGREGYDETTRERMRQAEEELAEEEKAAVLAAAPVDHETYEQHKTNRTVTPEIEAGYTRFKIEDCVGQELDEWIYDDLHTSQQRRALRGFTDLSSPEHDLAQRDRYEAQNGTLLSKRQHHAMTRKLVIEAIGAVWGECGSLEKTLQQAAETELTPFQIRERLAGFLERNMRWLRSYMGWRIDQSHDPVAIFRWMLKRVGLNYAARQVHDKKRDIRFRMYRLDDVLAEKMLGYAETRRILLKKKAEQREQQKAAAKAHLHQRNSKRGYITPSTRNDYAPGNGKYGGRAAPGGG